MAMIVTLLSDFGSTSPYPAAMKAVIAGLCDATLIDITHDVRRHDVRMGAYLLAAVAPWLPAGTVHLAVVDPDVGTARRALIVQAGGQWFVGPDNGLLLPAARRVGLPRIFEITAREIRTSVVSSTFHGRDVFAPIAGRLAVGTPAEVLGTPIDEYADLDFGSGRRHGDVLRGSISYIDPFGNLVTNISSELLEGFGKSVQVRVGRRVRAARIVRTYGEVARGDLAVVPGSDGLVEIALREGSAAADLGASAEAAISVAPRDAARSRR